MKIAFLAKIPTEGNIISIDREMLSQVSGIVVDGTILAFEGTVIHTDAREPEEVNCVLSQPTKTAKPVWHLANLVDYYLHHKLSHRELAKKIGVHEHTIGRLLKGGQASKKTITKINYAFDVDLQGIALYH